MRVDVETKKKVINLIKVQAPDVYKKLPPNILDDDSITAEYLTDMLINALSSLEKADETS